MRLGLQLKLAVLVDTVLMVTLIGVTGELAAQAKKPIPHPEAQQTARKAASEVFGGRFAKAKTVTEKIALANDMMDAAAEVPAGSVDQYVLLKIAADIAAAGGDAPTAVQAVEKLAVHFDVPGPKLMAETLLATARSATTSGQQKAIGETVSSIADAVADVEEYELALELCETGRLAARKVKEFALAKDLTAKTEAIKKRQEAFLEYQDAARVLDKNPTDPAANLAVGRYHCFVKGNWESGVAKLALGSDAALKEAAVQDLRGGTTAEQQAAIGDAWWEVAENKQGKDRGPLRLRAEFWYRQALGSLQGLARLKIQQRIDQSDDEMLESKVSEPIPVGEIYCLASEDYGVFAPDGDRILTTSRDNALRLWHVATRREVGRYSGHTGPTRVLYFATPEGNRIVSAAVDATIRVWDTEAKREVSRIKISTSPQGRMVAVVVSGGKRLLWCGDDKWVHITDLEAGKDFQLFDIRRGDAHVYVVAFTQDGRWALSGGFESAVRFWSVTTGKAVSFNSHAHVYSGDLTPDGRLALTAGSDRLLRVWNTAGPFELARYVGHGGHVYAVAFSPDGRRILSGDSNGEVRLWDTKTAQELHCYRGHTKPISRVAFSPDGRYALSSANDGVRLLGLPP